MTKFLTITDDELVQIEQLRDRLWNWEDLDHDGARFTISEIIRCINYRAKTPDITPEEWDYINNNQDQRYICPEVLRDAVETGNTHFWVDFLLGGHRQ